MHSFRERIERIESGIRERSALNQIDFSRWIDEALEAFNIALTGRGLQLKLHREPTEEELARELEAGRAQYASLTTDELIRIVQRHGKR